MVAMEFDLAHLGKLTISAGTVGFNWSFMIKNLFKVAGLSALPLTGCNELEKLERERIRLEETTKKSYFIELPSSGESSPDGEFVDIDCDGDQDYIITQRDYNGGRWKTRSYLFENDGKGNFTLKETYNPIKVK